MLVLTRQAGEEIVIDGGKIIVKVLGFRGDRVRLGIIAPEDVPVDRREIHQAKMEFTAPEPVAVQ